LRTEAGLPLYGHELGGELGLSAGDAGMGSYVKVWKPFFVGKAAYMAHESQRDAIVSRFRLDQKGARPPHAGDPIVDQRGRVVGVVTSCATDIEGYQLGQAYLKTSVTEEGTPIAVFAGGYTANGKSHARIGDKLPIPQNGTVMSRFPKRKK
jgi:glycine hydroxymethyltransferase